MTYIRPCWVAKDALSRFSPSAAFHYFGVALFQLQTKDQHGPLRNGFRPLHSRAMMWVLKSRKPVRIDVKCHSLTMH